MTSARHHIVDTEIPGFYHCISRCVRRAFLCAIVFLYKRVLLIEIGEVINAVRAKPLQRVTVVLSTEEISQILSHLVGVPKLIASLCYGAGLRKMDCHRLRIKDVDFDRNEITIRQEKGNKDRRVPLPLSIKVEIRTQPVSNSA